MKRGISSSCCRTVFVFTLLLHLSLPPPISSASDGASGDNNGQLGSGSGLMLPSLALTHDYPLLSTGNLSFVRLMCPTAHSCCEAVAFQLNGTDIRRALASLTTVVCSNSSGGGYASVEFVLGQKTEGKYSCAVNDTQSSNSVSLAAQPDVATLSATTHTVHLQSIHEHSTTTLECGIRPGSLHQSYSSTWWQVHPVQKQIPTPESVYNLPLEVSANKNGERYSCEVTINHNGSLIRTYTAPPITLSVVILGGNGTSDGRSQLSPETVVALSFFLPLIVTITIPLLAVGLCLCCMYLSKRFPALKLDKLKGFTHNIVTGWTDSEHGTTYYNKETGFASENGILSAELETGNVTSLELVKNASDSALCNEQSNEGANSITIANANVTDIDRGEESLREDDNCLSKRDDGIGITLEWESPRCDEQRDEGVDSIAHGNRESDKGRVSIEICDASPLEELLSQSQQLHDLYSLFREYGFTNSQEEEQHMLQSNMCDSDSKAGSEEASTSVENCEKLPEKERFSDEMPQASSKDSDKDSCNTLSHSQKDRIIEQKNTSFKERSGQFGAREGREVGRVGRHWSVSDTRRPARNHTMRRQTSLEMATTVPKRNSYLQSPHRPTARDRRYALLTLSENRERTDSIKPGLKSESGNNEGCGYHTLPRCGRRHSVPRTVRRLSLEHHVQQATVTAERHQWCEL